MIKVRVQQGFSLVELLVVISITALLVALLLPSLSQARVASNRVACSSIQRGLFGGFNSYASTYNSRMPAITTLWQGAPGTGVGKGWPARPWSSQIYPFLADGIIGNAAFLWWETAPTQGQVITTNSTLLNHGAPYFHCPDDSEPPPTGVISRLSYQMNGHAANGFLGPTFIRQMDGMGVPAGTASLMFGYGKPVANLWDPNSTAISAAQQAVAVRPYISEDWIRSPSDTILVSEFKRPGSSGTSSWMTSNNFAPATNGYNTRITGSIYDVLTFHQNVGNFLFNDGHVSAMNPIKTVGDRSAAYFTETPFDRVNVFAPAALDGSSNLIPVLGMWVKDKGR